MPENEEGGYWGFGEKEKIGNTGGQKVDGRKMNH